MRVLLIINDAPYGTENAYNALRLAMALQKKETDGGEPGKGKRDDEEVIKEVRIFLMGDAVSCALPGQATPSGYYNIERMLKLVIVKGAQVRACGSCTEARGLKDLHLIEGVQVSNIAELAQWVVDSDRVLNF